MKTVLEAVLQSVLGSITTGAAWDFTKGVGLGVLNSFKNRFQNSQFFKSEDHIQDFLKDLTKKEVYNTENPLKDVGSIYEKCTRENNSNDFIDFFTEWLKENKHQFEQKGGHNLNQSATNYIHGNQTAINGGKIINGNVTNF
ncbi:MAG: hypothetical protein JJT76_00620 [Clostridiaceae bacterium]|nr:hypothetical protein [Clostridiaceae bacterium]